VTVTIREGPQEMTLHFCSVAHARESLGEAYRKDI